MKEFVTSYLGLFSIGVMLMGQVALLLRLKLSINTFTFTSVCFQISGCSAALTLYTQLLPYISLLPQTAALSLTALSMLLGVSLLTYVRKILV